MRLIRNLTDTLLVTSLASLGYAWTPARATTAPAGDSRISPETPYAAQQDEAKPPRQGESKPSKEIQEAKPPKVYTQQVHPPQQEKPGKEQNNAQKEQKKEASRNQRQRETKAAQPQEARQKHGRPAGRHARIPDRDFKGHFGRPHPFTVRQVITTTRIIPNQTQFVYGGYTFIFLDPWPDDWALTDDCYIDYIDDEYVLINLAHPGVQIALSIVAE